MQHCAMLAVGINNVLQESLFIINYQNKHINSVHECGFNVCLDI